MTLQPGVDERPPAGAPTPRLAIALLALVLLAAGAARALHGGRGLPYLHEFDEPQTAGTALRIVQTGDYNPAYFNYPSLPIYLNVVVDSAHYLYLMAQPDGGNPPLRELDEIRTGADTGYPWTISHPSFYLWNRWLTALMGTAGVLLTFLLGRELAGPWAGLAAAALIGGLNVHIEHSAIVTPNVPFATLALLAVWLAVRYVRHDRPASLIWSMASAGLAASTKYNAAASLIAPGAALARAAALGTRGYRRWLWAALILVPAAAFVAGTPYSLLDMPAFLRGAGGEVRHYLVTGQKWGAVEPGVPHLLHQAGLFGENLGPVAIALALIGLPRLLADPAGRTALAFPVVFLLYMTRAKIGEPRNFIVLYPFAAVAFGAGLTWAFDRALPVGARAGRRGATPRGIAAGAVAALCAFGLASAVVDGRRVWTTPESRTVAIHRAAEILKQPGLQGARVGVAEELRVHEADLRSLGAPYEVTPWLELVCGGADEHDLIVTARSFRPDLPMQNEFTAIMDTLRPPGMTPIETIGPEHGVHLHWPSKNPGVVLMARAGATKTAAAGTDPPPADAGPACRRLPWSLAVETDEPAATPPVVLPAGRHILVWRAQADGFRHGRADYRVALNEAIAGTLMRPIEERTLQAAMESSIHLLPVTLEADRKLTLQFELSADPAGRTDSGRGSVYLESFFVLSPKGP